VAHVWHLKFLADIDCHRRVSYASNFKQDVRSFVEMIRGLADSCPPLPAWTTWRTEKIRIAIIDTGIDDDDILIETALACGRIKACRCFVNDPEDHKDFHGHGTHVTRLLLEMAPSAELYIAKVSDNQSINVTDLNRIAEASSHTWGVMYLS
jgi:subtilisin family serine protease